MWSKIKYYIKELIKMYSDQTSFFAKKRIESGIAFIIMEYGMVHWLILNVSHISGYIVNKIQQEKKIIKI